MANRKTKEERAKRVIERTCELEWDAWFLIEDGIGAQEQSYHAVTWSERLSAALEALSLLHSAVVKIQSTEKYILSKRGARFATAEMLEYLDGAVDEMDYYREKVECVSHTCAALIVLGRE